MIDQEKLLKYLNDKVGSLDKFIVDHRKKIAECDARDSDKMRMHFESIGKLQARKNELETLIFAVNSGGFKNG